MAGLKPERAADDARRDPPRRGTPTQSDEDDRGQLLLVGAFGVAVLLLVFAGVLNTVTVTESVASRSGQGPEARAVAAFQDDVERGVGGVVARVNDDGVDYDTTVDRLERGVGNWSDTAALLYAPDATAANVTVTDTTEGSRIAQSSDRTLTNASGTANWTLATGVEDLRRFRLRLNRSSLVNGSCASADCATLVVDDGGDNWTVAVNDSAVVVDGPATSGQCAVSEENVTVDVTAGTVDGRPCEALAFAEGLSAPYDLRYRDGDNANGTYSVVVNASVSSIEDDDYATNGSPSVSAAVYAVDVGVDYRSARLAYGNDIRVARGEPDE